jgi:hypothetical protein
MKCKNKDQIVLIYYIVVSNYFVSHRQCIISICTTEKGTSRVFLKLTPSIISNFKHIKFLLKRHYYFNYAQSIYKKLFKFSK